VGFLNTSPRHFEYCPTCHGEGCNHCGGRGGYMLYEDTGIETYVRTRFPWPWLKDWF
jgi:hypothetical protein